MKDLSTKTVPAITTAINPTMSSREIAELVNSRHDNVKKTIERLIEKRVIQRPPINEAIFVNILGLTRVRVEYVLPLSTAATIVAKMKFQCVVAIVDKAIKTSGELKAIITALDDFDVPEECSGMYVYAIRNEGTGNLKLGISRNPEQRVSQLQTGCDAKLTLVAKKLAVNGFSDEKSLHQLNSTYRIRGEWFSSEAGIEI